MRIETPPNTSLGGALIRLRCPFAVDEVRITFLYRSEEHLRQDYNRSVRAKRINGVATTRTHTLRLERSKRGEYWFDFGLRHYLKRSGPVALKQRYIEKPGHRIAVPVLPQLTPTLDRQEVLSEVAASTDLFVVFCLWDQAEDPDLRKTLSRHAQDALGPHAGTRPIELRGLESLGHLAFTKNDRQRDQGRREGPVSADKDERLPRTEGDAQPRERFGIPIPLVRRVGQPVRA